MNPMVPFTKQGVRDLNQLGKRWTHRDIKGLEIPNALQPSGEGPTSSYVFQAEVADCIYDPAAEQDIKDAFVFACVKHEWDPIHETRLFVTIPVSEDQWYRFLLRKKWAGVSLWFRLWMLTHLDMARQMMREEGYNV